MLSGQSFLSAFLLPFFTSPLVVLINIEEKVTIAVVTKIGFNGFLGVLSM